MLTLYLASRPLDISQVDLQLVYEAVTSISERKGNFSYTTTLQNTPEVERLVGMLYDPLDDYTRDKFYIANGGTTQKDAPAQPFNVRDLISARLECDGLTVFEGYARITQATGRGRNYKYELELIGDNAPWVTPASALNLRDLEGETQCYTAAIVTDENNVFCFPFIEYGNFTNNLAPGLPLVDIENLYPALFVRNLIHAGFTQLGYRVRDTFFTGDLANLIMPFTQDKFRTTLGAMESVISHFNYDDLNYCVMSYSGGCSVNDMTNTNYSYVTFFDYTDTPDFAAIPSPGLVAPYVDAPVACGDVELCFTFNYGFTLNDSVSARDLYITVELKSSLDGVILTDSQIITNANKGTHNFTVNGCAVISYGADIFVEYTVKAYVSPGMFPVTILDPAFNVVLDYHQLEISHSLSKENFLWRTFDNAPEMTLLDLISNVSRMFNLVITTARDSNEVTIQSYNQFFTTVEEAQKQADWVDWSGKLDYASDMLITFPNTKDVNFSYTQDGDDLAEKYRAANNGASYGDYEYLAGGTDETETVTADKVAATQATSVYFEGTFYAAAFIVPRMIEPNAAIPSPDVTGWTPRILFFDRTTPPLGQYWLLGTNHGTATSIYLSFPLCYFVGASGDLTFEALFDVYYRDCVVSFTQRRLIEAVFVLAANDIAALDFGRPVWLGDRWVYVQKVIGWNPNLTALTRVELREI